MTSFFRQAHRHRAPGGRMLIFFGASGDMDYLKRLMAGEEFSWA
jgi:release factor glutamine methyltransferase